jgi:hypothetical protein
MRLRLSCCLSILKAIAVQMVLNPSNDAAEFQQRHRISTNRSCTMVFTVFSNQCANGASTGTPVGRVPSLAPKEGLQRQSV